MRLVGRSVAVAVAALLLGVGALGWLLADETRLGGTWPVQIRAQLEASVGEALADYIRHDRVTASRVLFVTGRAPHRPFKDGQILNHILKDAFSRTGLKPPVPYVGSHVLRHSLAVNLIQRGASLEEIGDMLRHRSQVSTMIYARLDIDGLRSIAQPWPVAGDAQ